MKRTLALIGGVSLIILTAHQSPAPIREIPENSTPAPSQTSKAGEWKPPTRVDSPNRRFAVEMQRTNTDENSIDQVIIIREEDKEIARQKTVGFLLNVYWDDTGRYVAINNRRANSGDYLWIFSLPDGKCIKTPDTDQVAFLSKSALEAFKRLDARNVDEKLDKVWIKARGWWGSGKLLVQFAARYGYKIDNFPAYFVYDAQLSISGSKLGFTPGEARRVGYLSDQ